ncbi:FUSC family protein [Frigoribacterium faeni]|uniref:FUSC family protein n=1 Tax=Frigoribacterium faeni TaxID=145483 RepID=UPI00141B5819|nr:hypothetical protein [Frigoribacterium faeni]
MPSRSPAAASGSPFPRPRDLLRVGPHDRAHVPAVRVAVSVVVPLAVLVAIGHVEWAPYATFGAFASAFGRGLGRGPRLGMQLEAGALLIAVVVLGTALSAASVPAVALVPVVALVAGLASVLSDLRGWTPPGPLFPVFGLGVCAFVPAVPSSVGAAAVVSSLSVLLALATSLVGLVRASGRRALDAPGTRTLRRPVVAVELRRTLLHAAICLGASLVAGLVSIACGLQNPYWAMVSAVVPVVGRATSAQLLRAGHRLLGTLVGVGLAALLLAWDPTPVALVVAFGVLQFATELVVVRNYGLALVFITPMALSMPALGGGQVDVGALVVARGADTAIGVGVVVVALLATHRLRTRPRPVEEAPSA